MKPTDKYKHMYPFDIIGSETGYGWYGLILPIIKAIDRYNEAHPQDVIRITRVKEEFGRLYFYTLYAPDDIHRMILKAQEESAHTCEICGARGRLTVINGWHKTLCAEHAQEKRTQCRQDMREQRLFRKKGRAVTCFTERWQGLQRA